MIQKKLANFSEKDELSEVSSVLTPASKKNDNKTSLTFAKGLQKMLLQRQEKEKDKWKAEQKDIKLKEKEENLLKRQSLNLGARGVWKGLGDNSLDSQTLTADITVEDVSKSLNNTLGLSTNSITLPQMNIPNTTVNVNTLKEFSN